VLFRNLLLPTLLVPTIGACLMLLVLRGERAERLKGAAAAALAFLSGFVALTGWPRWLPVEATQRLFFLVALAGAAAWLGDPERKRWIGWITRGLLAAALPIWILRALIQHSWSAFESAAWTVGLVVVGLVLHGSWSTSLSTEGDRGDHVAGLVRLALLGGLAATLGLSGSARLAQLTGALTCGVGVVEVGSRVLRRRPWHGGAALALATAVLGLLMIGRFYADLQPWPAILLVLAFILLGVPTGGRPRLRLLALVPAVLALGLAVHATLNQPEDPYADYYTRLQPDGSNCRSRLDGGKMRWPR